MTERLLKFSEKLGYSRLMRDYVYDADKLSRFIEPKTMTEIAAAIGEKKFPRTTIVDILTRQNQSWQAPKPVMDNIARLGDDRSIAVLAGQQAGLLGGPYLALLKALAAVKRAHMMEQKSGVPVIPIFWIASEDHDFREISCADVFDISGALTRIRIDLDADRLYPPVGDLSYDASISQAVEQLQELFPDNDFKSEALDGIKNIYRPERKIADCFAEYMLSLVGELGLVFFNPYDAAYKNATASLMRDIALRHDEIKTTLDKTEADLTRDGYHIQVRKAPSAALLFHHTPERIAIHLDGDKFVAGKRTFTEKELTQAIAEHPLDFSPDVLTRPLAQSFFFPTAAIIAGPAEVAYLAQMMPLFKLFDLVPPKIMIRPSITVVEKRFESFMDKYEIGLGDLADDIEITVSKILGETFPDRYEAELSELALTVNDRLRIMKESVAEIDPGLPDTVDRTGEKLDYQLKELSKKIFAAHKRRHKTERERIYRLRDNLYPNNGLAERSVAPAYLISRYGRGIVDYIYKNMSPDETGHQILTLSEYHG